MILKTIKLTKIFSIKSTKYSILSGISGEFPSGIVTYILGPSGSGKSTLLRVISGQYSHDAGSIVINDNELNREDFIKKMIYFDQNPRMNLNLNLSIKENFNLFYGLLGQNISDVQIANELKKVNIVTNMDKKAGFLSAGQLQRLGLVLYLNMGRRIVLLDEPTSHLDTYNSLCINELIRETAIAKDTIIIVSTHDQNLAKDFPTYVLRGGHFHHTNIEEISSEFKETKKYFISEPAAKNISGFLEVNCLIEVNQIILPLNILNLLKWDKNTTLFVDYQPNSIEISTNDRIIVKEVNVSDDGLYIPLMINTTTESSIVAVDLNLNKVTIDTRRLNKI